MIDVQFNTVIVIFWHFLTGSTLNYDTHNWLGWSTFVNDAKKIVNNNTVEVELELFAAPKDTKSKPGWKLLSLLN